MTTAQRELLASFLAGPEWRWQTEPALEAYEYRCEACGRTTACAPDCAPDIRIPRRS